MTRLNQVLEADRDSATVLRHDSSEVDAHLSQLNSMWVSWKAALAAQVKKDANSDIVAKALADLDTFKKDLADKVNTIHQAVLDLRG